jgi:hypothetical protein
VVGSEAYAIGGYGGTVLATVEAFAPAIRTFFVTRKN